MVLASLVIAAALAGQTADPPDWWRGEVRPTPAQDPFYGRRGPLAPAPQRAIDPLLHRLWGLPPLSALPLRKDEWVVEVWARPTTADRQAVIRVERREDGKMFVQARAGLACCTPQIGRRVDIDAALDAIDPRLAALAALPAWSQPARVETVEAGDAVATVCIDGMFWDAYLVTPDRSAGLHRACESAQIGQIADVIEPALAAVLGRDPRFDALFARGADLAAERAAYKDFIAGGGSMRPRSEPESPKWRRLLDEMKRDELTPAPFEADQ